MLAPCLSDLGISGSASMGGSFSRAFSPGFRCSTPRARGIFRQIDAQSARTRAPLLPKARIMATPAPTTLPVIHMIDTEADTLADLAVRVEDRLPQVSEMLLREIGRATICTRERLPHDVVTMHATIEFIDEANSVTRSVELVYPKDADISAGRISVLTPIGAGLIGLRENQSILWPDRDGRQRPLKVVKVHQPAKA